MSVRISTDMENNAEEFWVHVNGYDVIHMANISERAREAVAPLLTDGQVREVTVDADTAEELRGWFEGLPGWHGGPEYAPHPLLFQEGE